MMTIADGYVFDFNGKRIYQQKRDFNEPPGIRWALFTTRRVLAFAFNLLPIARGCE